MPQLRATCFPILASGSCLHRQYPWVPVRHWNDEVDLVDVDGSATSLEQVEEEEWIEIEWVVLKNEVEEE